MRVLIDYRPALRQRTGVGEYAHQLATALVPRIQASDRIVLFSSSWKDRLSDSPIPGAETVDARVPVRLLNLAWHRLGWPPVERLAGPIDIAHSMHPLRIPARRAARIVTVHDLNFLDFPEGTTAEIRRDYAALSAEHARRAEAVIAVSHYTAAQVTRRLGVAAERVAICSPGAPDWSPRAGPPANGTILFMGTIEPRKNVVTLLDAYERLISRPGPHPPLVLAGRGGLDSAPLLARIARPPLAGRVRHMGYVADPERTQLYRDAAAVVMPSLDEGFGLPALEAMTVGVPVIASRRGALPEVLGDAGLLVEALDADALAAAMARVASEPGLAEALAARGIERARFYRWDRSAATLLEVYRQAIERRKGAR